VFFNDRERKFSPTLAKGKRGKKKQHNGVNCILLVSKLQRVFLESLMREKNKSSVQSTGGGHRSSEYLKGGGIFRESASLNRQRKQYTKKKEGVY